MTEMKIKCIYINIYSSTLPKDRTIFLNCEQTAFSMKCMLNFIQLSYVIQKSFCASMTQLEYQLHV